MPTVTRTELKYSIWRRLAFEDEALVGFDVPFTTTAIETTTALEDSNLTRGGVQSSRYDGRQFEIMEAVTSPGTGPLVGETSWVQDLGFSSNILTGTTTLTNAIQTGTDYILWPRDISAALIDNEINNVLRHTDAPHLWVPSLIDDADFDANDLTKWPASGSPTTREFITTTAKILLGERALHLVADAVDEGVTQFAAIDVTEGEQLLISVIVRVESGSAKVSLINSAPSEVIESVTVDEYLHTEVRFTETVPDDCEQVELRLLSAQSTATFIISPPVVLQSFSGRSYAAPDWLTDKGMVREAYYVPLGAASELSDSYIAGGERWPRAPKPDFITAPRFVTPNRIQFKASSLGPLGLHCLRPFATMSANTDTTTCEREYLVNKVVANIKSKRGDPKWRRFVKDPEGWGKEARNAANIAKARGYGKREMPIVANPVVVR